MRKLVHGSDRLVERKIGRHYNLVNVQIANEQSDYNLLESVAILTVFLRDYLDNGIILCFLGDFFIC